MDKWPSYGSVLVWPLYASFTVIKVNDIVIFSIGSPEKRNRQTRMWIESRKNFWDNYVSTLLWYNNIKIILMIPFSWTWTLDKIFEWVISWGYVDRVEIFRKRWVWICNFFTFKIALIFLPGIIAYVIMDKLTFHKKHEIYQVILYSFHTRPYKLYFVLSFNKYPIKMGLYFKFCIRGIYKQRNSKIEF